MKYFVHPRFCAFLCGAVFSIPVLPSASEDGGGWRNPLNRFAMLSTGMGWPERMTLPKAYQPAPLRTSPASWKSGITTTVFWCGELPTPKNPTTNVMSSWDPAWSANFGGYDDPYNRTTAYTPAGFVPKRNPFYIALPFNDCASGSVTKTEAAAIIPWFKSSFKRHGLSVCKDHWVAIRHGDRVSYAQWSDCGPFTTEDAGYVFGNARPSNAKNGGAGLDISPAVRDHLGLQSGEKCDWRFVEEQEVPDGPWKFWGANNPFTQAGRQNSDATPPVTFVPIIISKKASHTVFANAAIASRSTLAGASRLEELKRQRDAWFRTK